MSKTDNERYCVYAHILPNKLVYFGVCKNTKIRWQPSLYKDDCLYPYIQQYGWDNIEHLVIADGLTQRQAIGVEGVLIKQGKADGLCINKKDSGYCCKDYNKYMREYMKSYDRSNYTSKPENIIYNRVNNYNNRHYNRLITPLEAKEMYLLTGYIPDFIKSDDIPNVKKS